MISKKLITTLFAALFSTCFLFAQSSGDYLVAEWERAKTYTKQYLDAMPDSGYGFKPTPEMRSFAEQMLHLSDGNYNVGSAATGEKIPEGMGELEKISDKSKSNVTKITLAGYDFVISGIKKLTAAQLNDKIKVFGKFDLTREQTLQKVFEHQTHHRGQTTVYLRLEGIKPPQEKLF